MLHIPLSVSVRRESHLDVRGLELRIVVPWNRIARTTVGSALVGTGQYNGFFVTSFLCPSRRGDVGLDGIGVLAFERLKGPGLTLSFFLRVAWR